MDRILTIYRNDGKERCDGTFITAIKDAHPRRHTDWSGGWTVSLATGQLSEPPDGG